MGEERIGCLGLFLVVVLFLFLCLFHILLFKPLSQFSFQFKNVNPLVMVITGHKQRRESWFQRKWDSKQNKTKLQN